MALVPYLFDDALNDLLSLRRQMYNFFDSNCSREALAADSARPRKSGDACTLLERASGLRHIENDKDAFKVNLDVQHFKPDEIHVKMVDDFVVVEGKHEERHDEHGFISRQFQRRYKLPKDVDLDAVSSKLTSDGVLTIEAPKKVIPVSGKERIVSIKQTNVPVLAKLRSGAEKNKL